MKCNQDAHSDVKKSAQHSGFNYMPQLRDETSTVYTLKLLLNNPLKRISHSYCIDSGALSSSVGTLPPKLFAWSSPQEVQAIPR